MANRYWVGGTNTWNATVGTKWATTSGGAGGASVPTSADDVFFDAASGAAVVTIGATSNCKSINCTGFTGTITGTSALNVFGAFTLVSGMTWSYTGVLGFRATGTVTTAGKTIGGNISVNAAASTVTLGDALTCTGTITPQAGTFTTNGYSLTVSLIDLTGTSAKTINFGSSIVTITGLGFDNSGTNTTINAGTSQINFTSATATADFNSITLYNVDFTSTSAALAPTIRGVNTFNNLAFAGAASAAESVITFTANQTINGIFLIRPGADATCRRIVLSDTYGTARTISAGTVDLTDVTFQDITASGAATWAGTRLGNAGGNSGITFTAPKTVYYSAGTAGNWNASNWASGSGGTGTANNYPLPQDTAIIDDNSGTGTLTINTNYISGLDCTSRTTALTLSAAGATTYMFGSIALSSAVTPSGAGVLIFRNRSDITPTLNITSSGQTWTQQFNIQAIGATVQLSDACTTSNTVTLTNGTLGLNNNTFTVGSFSSSNANTRAIAFGVGNITVTRNVASMFTMTDATNFTLTGTPIVNISYTGATASTVVPPALSEANAFNFNFTSGTYALTFPNAAGTYSAKNVDFTGFAGTWAASSTFGLAIYGNLKLSASMSITSTADLIFSASSGTQTITTFNNTLNQNVTVDAGVNTTIQLVDNLPMSSRIVDFTNGILDLNGNTLTALRVDINAGTKRIIFNRGTLALTGSGATPAWNISGNSSGLTMSAGTGAGKITLTSASTKTFGDGSSLTYPCSLYNGGAGIMIITGSNTFTAIGNDVQPTNIRFTSGTTTTVGSFLASGVLGSLVTLSTTTTIQATVRKYSPWYVGANSTNGGNNTGLTFTAGGGLDYLSISYINGTELPTGNSGGFLSFF